jgi:LDH2 family malate/lactate/ureidoglycolate dehydrogenase
MTPAEVAANSVHAAPSRLAALVAAMFRAVELPDEAARLAAESLVDADREGIASHGVMLVPMYVDRIRAGSISRATCGRVVQDRGSAVVLDGLNALGQVTAHQAVQLLLERAPRHGLAAVAVRNAFHFGTAGRWASALAEHGLIGIALSNTRPLMPAPGGAERVVGNNPIAIAMPNRDGVPVMLDMATSATAMGKIRLADSAGRTIPEGWATDGTGLPTTDPAAAIKGMLLPAAGPKGFGLAVMIDLLCGGLSSGAIGDAVRPLYGDPAMPYGCAHFFLAIDVAFFRDLAGFGDQVTQFSQRVRDSARAPGIDRLFSPGEPGWLAKQAAVESCQVDAAVARQLVALATGLGVSSDGVFSSPA